MRAFLLTIITLCAVAKIATAEPATAAFSLVPRKPLPISKLGINAFVNDPRFGTVRAQMQEVRRNLKLRQLRVLFAWNDQVQPTPTAPIDFSFYDEIVRSIPVGSRAIVVLTDIPSWMRQSSNWLHNDPRRTFAERWVKAVCERYGRRSRLLGFEIWNEPNTNLFDENEALELIDHPENYISLLQYSAAVVRHYAPRKKVLSAATTAINQDFPDTLNYNKQLFALGMESLVDIWSIHFYGSHLENIIFSGGVAEFLNELSKPIWITEIGKQGANKQRAYMEQYLPLLMDLVPGIARAYLYQFTEASPADLSYGLRTLTPGQQYSDLYLHLAQRRSTRP